MSLFDFSDYIAERTRDFVGREWVFAEIDAWLADPDAPRYFIITGEPGIGKTAIAARLTQIRDLDAYHFCIARDATTIDPLDFARDISHQLTAIDDFAINLLEEQGVQVNARLNVRQNYGKAINIHIERLIGMAQQQASTTFNRIIINPLKLLYADGFDRQLVILVDALDEAAQLRGMDSIVGLLANARGLPPQVRFVLTSRPESEVLRRFERQHIPHLVLDAGGAENQEDIRAYVQHRLATSDTLHARLSEQAIAPETFAARVAEASEGNFLYLFWLLRGIEEGTQRFNTLDALPHGLDGVYREYLATRRIGNDMERYRQLYRPILGMLMVSKAPLNTEQLSQLTGIGEQKVFDTLCDLQQFLDSRLAVERQYQLYHQSIADFLNNRQAAGNYWISSRESHQHVVNYYRSLGDTWEEVSWALVDDYGLEFLGEHLYDLSDLTDFREYLFSLIESRSWTIAKHINTLWIGSLSRDLQRASELTSHTDLDGWIRAMGYQLRRALLESATSRVSRRAILFLVKVGQVERALDFARSKRSGWDRFRALRVVAREIVTNQPSLAIDVLGETAQSLNNSSALQACRARMAVAKDILQLLPDHPEMVHELMTEAQGLEPQIDEVDLIEYLTDYVLPVVSLTEGLNVAVQRCTGLPPVAQARALCATARAIQDEASKRELLEEALHSLDGIIPTSETLAQAIKCTVDLLDAVREEERAALLDSIVEIGERLQVIGERQDYAVWQGWAINRVARVNLGWSNRMTTDSNWQGGTDAFSGIIRETAKFDPQEALRLIEKHMPNHIQTSGLLVEVIATVARHDVREAEAMRKKYDKRLQFSQRDAYVAIAEGYLIKGNLTKALETFDASVVAVDDESVAHRSSELKLEILKRSSGFLTLDEAQRFTFPEFRKSSPDYLETKGHILAFIAAREGNMEYLNSDGILGGVQVRLTGAYHLAEHVGPDLAREYLAAHHLDSPSVNEEVPFVLAHVAAIQAQQNPERLDELLQHYRDPDKRHHFCAYMLELPSVLEHLVSEEQIASDEAREIVEELFDQLLEWDCPRGGEPTDQDFARYRCRCYDDCESVLRKLISLMTRLSLDRAKEMVQELPDPMMRPYAWLTIAARTLVDEAMVDRGIRLVNECLIDPLQRAEMFYGLAMRLPATMSDRATELIESAEQLLKEEPMEYRTNRFGMRIRLAPSKHTLFRLKAQAFMSLVHSVEQLQYIGDSLTAMDTFLRLEDKLKPLNLLIDRAKKWPREDQLTLLWKMYELSRSSGLLDVDVLVAASVPILHKLRGKTAIWDLYERIEWALEELPLPE